MVGVVLEYRLRTDKKLEGKNPKKNKQLAIPPKKVDSKDVMAEYFSMAMKECANEIPSADILRAEIEEYIAARGCEGYRGPRKEKRDRD